jgi:hypothetical protein
VVLCIGPVVVAVGTAAFAELFVRCLRGSWVFQYPGVSLLSFFRAGHGQSQIQCRSESVARRSGQREFAILACESEV